MLNPLQVQHKLWQVKHRHRLPWRLVQQQTATAAASTAQSAIDTMETQVVLSNEGMSLRAVNDAGNANLNGQDVVQFGTTTKFLMVWMIKMVI